MKISIKHSFFEKQTEKFISASIMCFYLGHHYRLVLEDFLLLCSSVALNFIALLVLWFMLSDSDPS